MPLPHRVLSTGNKAAALFSRLSLAAPVARRDSQGGLWTRSLNKQQNHPAFLLGSQFPPMNCHQHRYLGASAGTTGTWMIPTAPRGPQRVREQEETVPKRRLPRRQHWPRSAGCDREMIWCMYCKAQYQSPQKYWMRASSTETLCTHEDRGKIFLKNQTHSEEERF